MWCRAGVLALSIALLAPVAAARASFEHAVRSVVSVLPQWPADARRTEEPEGSGVVVFDGRTVLTAAHVVDRALSVNVRTVDGEVLPATLSGRNRATDLAVLKIEKQLPAMEIEPENPKLGERVCAIGNPHGVGLSLRCGVVSALHRAGMGFNRVEDFVQTDAAVNPGDSGGALVNAEGKLVGVLQAIFSSGADTSKGLSFAVSAPLAARVGEALAKTGRFRPAVSGLRLAFGRTGTDPVRLGARVRAVKPQSLGERAGVKTGDLILRAAERRIRKPADFVSVMAGVTDAGITLTIIRDGKETELNLVP